MSFLSNTLFLILLHFCEVPCQNNPNSETLKLVNVIFRHGNRTPDIRGVFPKDPYVNESYYPYGFGQLTNKGKTSAYSIGKALRARYNSFIGPLYTPEILDAVSTDVARTKMSLELVLAGLFPPKGTILEWEMELNWQPIPYDQISLRTNPLLSVGFLFCPKYISLLTSHLKTTEGIALQKKYEELFEYIEEQYGLNSKGSFLNIANVYSTLTAQKDFDLELPSWTESIYPKPLEEAISEYVNFATSTPELKQLTGGFVLKKIIGDTKAKFENTLQPAGRKLFFYSAHDINIIYILSAMNIYSPKWPPYSSYLLIEAHEINSVAGIKVLYQDYSQEKPRIVKIPGCDEFCPFQDVLKLLNDNLVRGDDSCKINSSIEPVNTIKGFNIDLNKEL